MGNPYLLNPEWSTLRKLLAMKALAGKKESFAKCVQTGNPVAFATNIEHNVKISIPDSQTETSAKVWVSGTNIWNEQWENGVINSDGSIGSAPTRILSKNYIPVVAGKTYVMLWPAGINRGRGAYYDADFHLVQYKSDFPDTYAGTGTYQYGTFTVPAGSCYVKFCTNASYGTTYNNNISLNYPEIDLNYHAYNGAEYDVTLPTTEVFSIIGNNVVTCNTGGNVEVNFSCDNPKEDKLVIMTYNMQSFNGLNADKEMQNDIVEEYAPSIIGMQETGINYYPSKIKEYITSAYWDLVGGEQYQKTAIASKYGLSNVQYHAFTDNSSEIKGYQTAEITFKGKKIFFVNAHTISSSSAEINAAQCKELFDLVKTKETFILVGDLNTDISNTSGAQYAACIKQYVDEGYNLANCSPVNGFIGTYTSGKTAEGIWYSTDNIITSADLVMSNVRRDTIKIEQAGIQDKAIDHVALICDIDLA